MTCPVCQEQVEKLLPATDRNDPHKEIRAYGDYACEVCLRWCDESPLCEDDCLRSANECECGNAHCSDHPHEKE